MPVTAPSGEAPDTRFGSKKGLSEWWAGDHPLTQAKHPPIRETLGQIERRKFSASERAMTNVNQ
jgi:hypothetical protein